MSQRVELLLKPQGPVLKAYMESRARVSFIMGPLGSGKTYQSCLKLIQLMTEQKVTDQERKIRRTRFIAIRNTYSELLTTTIEDFKAIAGDLGEYKKGGAEPPQFNVRFALPDGTLVFSDVIFIALDNADAVRKLRGMQCTGVWLNEVKELNKAVVDMCDLRIGRYPSIIDGGPSWYGIIGDTNSPDTDHWYYHLAEELKPIGWEFFKQAGGVLESGINENGSVKWVVNPEAENLQNLPKNYYEQGVQGKSDDWIRVNLANQYGFVADGKPVYPEYNDHVHCKTFELDPNLPVTVGLDFGRTPAAVFGQRSISNQWRWRYELVTHDMGAVEFAEELNRFINTNLKGFVIGEIWGDPSGDNRSQSDDSTPFLMLRRAGIEAKPTSTNDPIIRREAVATNLRRLVEGQPALVVHPDCQTLRKGLNGAFCYARVQVAGDERYKDKPVKNHFSHVCEAAEYLMLGGGEGKVLIQRPKTKKNRSKKARNEDN